jgi:hypothetical protein
LVVGSLSACADSAGPRDVPLLHALQVPAQLAVDGAASRIEVTASSQLQFTVVDGEIDVRAEEDGRLFLDEFFLVIEDILVSPSVLPPDGLQLRELSVRLDYPVVAALELADDGLTGQGDVAVAVTLDWSAEFGEDANVYPLRSIELEDLPVHLDLSLVDGRVQVGASAVRNGMFWEWAERFSLSDLELEVSATSDRVE